jgi:two-component system cell cycle response regulator DivK
MRQSSSAVLLDLKLPLLDSWERAHRIHALPAPLNALPIIAVTAHAMLEDRDRALAAGCDEDIAKPLDFRALQEKLERLLMRRHPS